MHRAYTSSSLNPQVDLDRALHQAFQIEGPPCPGASSKNDRQRSGVFVSMFLMPDVKDVVMVPQVQCSSIVFSRLGGQYRTALQYTGKYRIVQHSEPKKN